jgi:hypothetical protein
MNSILWTTLFAVLMAGAIVVMLRILVGLVTDSATWTGRESRVWLAGSGPFARWLSTGVLAGAIPRNCEKWKCRDFNFAEGGMCESESTLNEGQ